MNIAKIGVEAAVKAGAILRKGYGTHFDIQSKEGVHNLVTEYDHASEKFIISYLKDHFPDHNFLGEESGKTSVNTKNIEWVIDPLDGTVNFAHGIPFFAVSIAARQQGEVLFGVVYHPITEELFVAEKGKGSFLNGKKLQVSKVKELERSMLVTGFPYNLKENPHHCIEHFIDILHLGIPIRRLGVAALDLSYVAAGRFEGFFEVTLGPWDCAAGNLMIEEAGGKVTTWDGKPFHIDSLKPILATNGFIHSALTEILSRRKE